MVSGSYNSVVSVQRVSDDLSKDAAPYNEGDSNDFTDRDLVPAIECQICRKFYDPRLYPTSHCGIEESKSQEIFAD